jgi:hypothetical protein
MVEATENCDINQGKYAQQSKVHKIRKTNFVDIHYNHCNLRIREAIRRMFAKNGCKEFSIITQSRNFACKTARWGGDVFFSTKMSLLP